MLGSRLPTTLFKCFDLAATIARGARESGTIWPVFRLKVKKEGKLLNSEVLTVSSHVMGISLTLFFNTILMSFLALMLQPAGRRCAAVLCGGSHNQRSSFAPEEMAIEKCTESSWANPSFDITSQDSMNRNTSRAAHLLNHGVIY
ncbi:hypothetical protein TNCV_932911 [Trichonephila clavipes]|nr:hypothetical protein TNCV_932911 [Trichonephila clavipes]